jgi:hypothetical protein
MEREEVWCPSTRGAEHGTGADRQQRPLRSRRWRRLTAGVRPESTTNYLDPENKEGDNHLADTLQYHCMNGEPTQ